MQRLRRYFLRPYVVFALLLFSPSIAYGCSGSSWSPVNETLEYLCPICSTAISVINEALCTTLSKVGDKVDSANKSINKMNKALAGKINLGNEAISKNGTKIATQIEANGNANRSLAIRQHLDDRLQHAYTGFSVPSNVCANSASGGMQHAQTTYRATAGSYRRGATSLSDPLINKAVNSPAPTPDVQRRRVAAIHAKYCDALDYKAYGGTQACPHISGMPGADKRIDSLFTGAGPDGRAPTLTFTQAQTNAARMYTQNSIYRNIGRALEKGEANTPAGIKYIGLRTQYNAIIDAAAEPQRMSIAKKAARPKHQIDTPGYLAKPICCGLFQC